MRFARVLETIFARRALALRGHRLEFIEINGITAGLTFCQATWTFFRSGAPAVRKLVFHHVSAAAFGPRFVAHQMLLLFGPHIEHLELGIRAPHRTAPMGESKAPTSFLFFTWPMIQSLSCTGIRVGQLTTALRQSAGTRLDTIPL